MAENILEVKNLTKDYGDFVLNDLSFSIPRGVIMGLIGENGAGKSTTVNCILNEIKKNSGNILIFGKDHIIDECEIKDKIGIVFDENHFPDIFTPKEIEKYMSGIYTNWDSIAFRNYLKQFELPAKKKIKDFSKGMKADLSGRIQTGSYTNRDRQKVYTTDIVVEEIEFGESKGSNQSQQKSETPHPETDPYGFMDIPDGIDEEMPFA